MENPYPANVESNIQLLTVFYPAPAVQEVSAVDVDGVEPERLLCRSAVVLGHGRIDDLHDVVVIDQHRFDRAQSLAVARDVALFNAELVRGGRRYLLVGVGRWGSSDPFRGIPVRWDQISGAQVILEAGFRDFKVAPSQGSHFFQNLTARGVGFFTVNPQAGEGLIVHKNGVLTFR